MSSACPTCNDSTLGFYAGPNGVDRCLNCLHDVSAPKASEPPPPEPNKDVGDKAESGPKSVMTTAGTVQDKATRGPKESKSK